MTAGEYSVASAIYNRILEIEPSNSRAAASIGVAYLFLNDLDRGYSQLKKALEMNSQEPIALWNIAGLMHEFNFHKKLATAVKKARAVPKPSLLYPFATRI